MESERAGAFTIGHGDKLFCMCVLVARSCNTGVTSVKVKRLSYLNLPKPAWKTFEIQKWLEAADPWI
jgi:hypothetical protein